jgi:hypothetical protein
MYRWLAILIVALMFGALSGGAAYQRVQPQGARSSGKEQVWHEITWQDIAWHEITWPFPRDGWPAGRAFHCDAAACGTEAELYVRPKIGFCNCDTGVADDDEVDRVADLDLMSKQFVPLAAGHVVKVAGLTGRSRGYELGMADGSRRTAIGFALSRRCDLMVAVVQGDGSAAAVRHLAEDFLNSEPMVRWMMSELDND